jgi:uncharacterized protein (TIGR02284 family)
MSHKELIAILNDLAEVCSERQKGFRWAADHISNVELRRLFNIFSQQRAQFLTELQAEVHRLGGSPRELESPSSESWRAPAGGTAVADYDEASVIAECQTAESAAVHHYQEALKEELPLDVEYVVKRQYMDIKDAYDRMRILQRAA